MRATVSASLCVFLLEAAGQRRDRDTCAVCLWGYLAQVNASRTIAPLLKVTSERAELAARSLA